MTAAWVAFFLLFVSCESETPADPPADNTPMAKISYLALGDSYTIGESVDPEDRWPDQLVARINAGDTLLFKSPQIIARTGWRTDDLINAIEESDIQSTYDLVSLLIGVNNQYQGKDIEIYQTEFRELLETAIGFAGEDSRRVLVVSIPDYGYTPFGQDDQPKISEELDRYNNINRDISSEYNVMYVNITDISRMFDPSLVAPDRLHPSGVQYGKWVDRILATGSFLEFLSTQAP